jgi:hypothetical protein
MIDARWPTAATAPPKPPPRGKKPVPPIFSLPAMCSDAALVLTM